MSRWRVLLVNRGHLPSTGLFEINVFRQRPYVEGGIKIAYTGRMWQCRHKSYGRLIFSQLRCSEFITPADKIPTPTLVDGPFHLTDAFRIEVSAA